MRILVLDDDKNRHKTFARNLIGNEHVVHAYTHDEAITALNEQEKFDVVFLDHDLNDCEHKSLDYSSGYGGPVELTGLHVARHVANLPEEKLPRFAIVHSFNPSGAAHMMTVLRTREMTVIRELFHESSGSMFGS